MERNKVATNIHVIAYPGRVYVKSADKKTTWKVEGVVAYDVKNDLVILKVVGKGEALPLGNSDIVQEGESVSVVGFPDEKFKVRDGPLYRIRNNDKWLQMEVDTAGGSSGGPVLNSKGQVVGINKGVGDFYSYAIPSNILKVLLTQSASTEPLEQWHKRELIRSYNYYHQAEKKYGKKYYDKAIANLDETIRLNPEFIRAYLKRGDAKSALGDHEGAISDYDKVIELDPEYVDVYNHRGAAKWKLDDHKGAINDYDRAIELNPKHVDAYSN
ncbi:MAG: tetratricopeptide repeat protein, partial [Candidatus Poribacteria bacterium]|nr:tetratricopeptide repeat protein [Candidatus Poribacteria bacterium]